jgi:hypothetical protein
MYIDYLIFRCNRMNKMDIYNIFHKITPEILFDLHQEIDRPVTNEHLQQKRLFQFSHM